MNTTTNSPAQAAAFRRLLGLLFLILLMAALPGRAQNVLSGAGAEERSLPDAPMVQAPQSSTGSASVSGVVSDIRGGLVPGATITLNEKGHSEGRESKSDSEGRYSFGGLEPGSYTVVISAAGLETFLSPAYVLKVGEKLELPDVALPIATNTTTVNVVMSQSEIAEEEMKLEEKQRILGVLPNFYTSFLWNAAPMTAKQKFKLAAHARLDPTVFVTTAITAGIEQARNTFPEYGTDADAYGKRYGAAFADSTIGRTLGTAVFPSIFRQDPRYFLMGPGHSFLQRFKHAALSGLVARGDNGKWQPNYSHLAANASAGAISTLYHPDTDSAGKLALDNTLIGLAGGAAQGLVREFLFSHVTTKVPKYATGKPADKPAVSAPATQP